MLRLLILRGDFCRILQSPYKLRKHLNDSDNLETNINSGAREINMTHVINKISSSDKIYVQNGYKRKLWQLSKLFHLQPRFNAHSIRHCVESCPRQSAPESATSASF